MTNFDNYLQSCNLENPRNIPLFPCNLMSPVYCTIHACLHPIIILTYYLTSIINHYSPFYVLHYTDYSYVYFQQLRNNKSDFICHLNSKKNLSNEQFKCFSDERYSKSQIFGIFYHFKKRLQKETNKELFGFLNCRSSK